jgi:putative endonuclease
MPKTHKQKIGKIGEDIACKFLAKRGFTLLERNFWKKWGEIDLIVEKDITLHFVEVKTVSCENLKNISVENDNYRPEDNIHPWKLKRLSRTIQTYLLEKDIPTSGDRSEDREWQFDAVIIFLDQESKKAKVLFLENITL